MTRVNAGIPPEVLCDQHLGAEYREIGRISTEVLTRIKKGRLFDDIPSEFTLNKGHNKFFYGRGKFIKKRFAILVAECKRRGRATNLKFRNTWIQVPHLFRDYEPTTECVGLLVERIIQQMPSLPKFWGRPTTPEAMIEMLLEGVKREIRL